MPRAKKPRVNPWDVVGHAWVGHWWMGGIRCYDRGEAAEDLFKFYHESFQIKPIDRTNFRYELEVRYFVSRSCFEFNFSLCNSVLKARGEFSN